MRVTTIYALHDPTDVSCRVYVGKTCRDLRVRLSGHLCDARREPTSNLRHRWINSLLSRGVKPAIVVLDVVGDDGWAEAEQFWIASLRAVGMVLANATNGGEGNPGRVASAETRAKMSRSLRGNPRLIASKQGRVFTEEHRKNISIGRRGKANPPDSLRRMADTKRGVPLTEEHRRKIGDSQRGKKMSAEAIQKRQAARYGDDRTLCLFKY